MNLFRYRFIFLVLLGCLISGCASVNPRSLQATNYLLDCHIVMLTGSDCDGNPVAAQLVSAVVPEAANLYRTPTPPAGSTAAEDSKAIDSLGNTYPYGDWKIKYEELSERPEWRDQLMPQLMLLRGDRILAILADQGQNLVRENRGDKTDSGRLLLSLLALRKHLHAMREDLKTGMPTHLNYERMQALLDGFSYAWEARGIEADWIIRTVRGAGSVLSTAYVLDQGKDLLWMMLAERLILLGYTQDLHISFLQVAEACYDNGDNFQCGIDVANSKLAEPIQSKLERWKPDFERSCEALAIGADVDKAVCSQ